MALTSIGDLSQTLFQSTRASALRQEITDLTQELSTGTVKDVNARLKGDFSFLTDIENNLTILDGHSIASQEADLFFEAAQQRLENVQDISTELSATLVSSTPTILSTVRNQVSAQANDNLRSLIASLNGSVAGLSIFSGVDSDQVPLANAEDLLADLSVIIGGATTAADARLAAQTWFDDPTGFEAAMYGGSTTGLRSVEVSPGETVTFKLRAHDPVFRDVLMNTALAALAAEPALGFGASVQNELLLSSGEGLAGVQDELSSVRGELGFSQARIEDAQARNASARLGFEISRTTLLEADPFETAIKLEDAQFRLESLLQITVRTSQLSLVNFL